MLGDLIENALNLVGVDKALVERWVGGPCGCKERKEKLNALGYWSRRIVRGKLDKAQSYLSKIMGLGG